ncbi:MULTISPECIES: lauroyl acyltransferase [unclassified Lysobacter]|jgi:KDO2-lipid IV(A) lauroyltransferase|uniref:lauroyl acyltransferase n=1 Tax=unclassified Lysobacter TaxID=2635362 RepID=UPI0006FDE354|nr:MULTISPECIES: lauroyl acyltransferase [unclassified Lysobacter]KRA81944.1 lipid A biosynthesis lauroyl acyltransferase [Lysobacter sp. Root667]KRC34848.1 lipid A biosynthesis lauroyl acyltransferase [Lysobacter sp. Root76]KRD70537.1 lipid A biosynthesis lauroyl acyltransferase [Lysobacter sp. Root96]
MTRFVARVLYLLASALARLPWSWLLRLGDLVAAAWRWRDGRESRVARINLELAYPELLPAERAQWHRAILRTTGRQILETLRLWTRPHQENLGLLRETHGTELFDAAIAAGRGVIVAAPHYGNWELLNQWLASRTPLAILYRPPESKIGEAFLNLVRADAPDRVTQIRAEGPAVRQLWKLLNAGGVTGILPDQQPKAGDGEFAPFFGVPALTMTLLGRLAGRTGATVLFAYCERIDTHTGAPGFALRIEPAPAQIGDADLVVATTALNAAVERIARRDPAQYQWTYKRYTLRPPGSGEENPYWNR